MRKTNTVMFAKYFVCPQFGWRCTRVSCCAVEIEASSVDTDQFHASPLTHAVSNNAVWRVRVV